MWKTSWGAAMLVIAAGGCFAQSGGGDPTHTKAALTLIDSLAAFADIEQNVDGDPAKAGDALTRFVKAPAAAAALLGEPFDPPTNQAGAGGIASAAGVPECLTTAGQLGCGSFATTTECDAGNFTFEGTGSQQCNACDATGTCDYAWNLHLTFAAGGISEDMYTAAQHVTVTPDQSGALAIDSTFDATVTEPDGTIVPASVRVCTCTPVTFDPSCGGGTTPTAGTVLVTAVPSSHFSSSNSGLAACGRVQVTGCGQVAVDDTCACPAGSTETCQ